MLPEFTTNPDQYRDFTKINRNHKRIDSFFDQISEKQQPERLVRRSLKKGMKLNVDNGDNVGNNSVFYRPMKTDTGTATAVQNRNIQRSLNFGSLNLPEGNQNVGQMRLGMKKLNLTKCGLINSLDTLNKERMNKLAQPKKTVGKSNNFVSVAEGVMKLHKDIPERFYSTDDNVGKTNKLNLRNIKPQAPKILTKTRTRPFYALSREHQDKLDMDEAKKLKMKAPKADTRNFQPPKMAALLKKSPKNPKKKVFPDDSSSDDVNFRAKPTQKTAYQPLKMNRPTKVLTIPSTPRGIKKHTPKIGKIAATPPQPLKRKEEYQLKKPKSIPFSFEKRHEELKKKKANLIKKTLDEEKRAREFRAKPIPKCVKLLNSLNTLQSKSIERNKLEEAVQLATFKARPANVLKIKPFKPVKEPHIISVKEFNFSLEDRIKERHKFDSQVPKTEKKPLQKKLKDHRRPGLEEQRRIDLLQRAEIKAQPIRKWKPTEIKTID